MRAAMMLALALAITFPAFAACPDGDPCETFFVYRVQIRPRVLVDARGLNALSLAEANATDANAFRDALVSFGTNGNLAIRYQVTMVMAGNRPYCECVFRDAKEICKAGRSNLDWSQCFRECAQDRVACITSGRRTSGNGVWYSFPAAGQCPAPNRQWGRPVERPQAGRYCDWQERAKVMKDAACISANLATHDLDALFANEQPCASLSQAQALQH